MFPQIRKDSRSNARIYKSSIPIELGSALINLTGIPSTPEAFLLSRPFIMEMTSDSETSDSRKVNEATEQNRKLMCEEDC